MDLGGGAIPYKTPPPPPLPPPTQTYYLGQKSQIKDEAARRANTPYFPILDLGEEGV